MPIVTRFFIKTGFIWLVISMIFYGFQQIEPTFRVAYHHSIGLGWVTQMIIGVGIWMFPRWSNELPKGPMWLWWLSYVTLNSGLVLRLVSEYYLVRIPNIFSPLLIFSGVLLWIATMAAIIGMWKRIKFR